MSSVQSEMQTFLKDNERCNYFYYLRKSNGTIAEHKEYLLDLILYYIFKLYILYHLGFYSQYHVFKIMDSLFYELENDEDRIVALKQTFFLKDVTIYNEVIALIDGIKDSYMQYIPDLILNAREVNNLNISKIKSCMQIIEAEMNDSTDITRKRVIS